jgi:hypothetical protein
MIADIVSTFSSNVLAVEKLVNFDRDIVSIIIDRLAELSGRLKEKQKIDNPQLNGMALLEFIATIRTNDALRIRYQVIFNQAVVLLVSHFASALGDLFRYGVSQRLSTEPGSSLLDEEFKMTFAELRERNWNLKDAAADLLIAKRDFTFQDMGSTHRAFREYLNVSMERDRAVNNVIAAQACRHVIVHVGARVTDRLLAQVSTATPRDLKPKLKLGEVLQFTPAEVTLIAENMREYVRTLSERVRSALL